jgi:hypothetical protein
MNRHEQIGDSIMKRRARGLVEVVVGAALTMAARN